MLSVQCHSLGAVVAGTSGPACVVRGPVGGIGWPFLWGSSVVPPTGPAVATHRAASIIVVLPEPRARLLQRSHLDGVVVGGAGGALRG